MGITKGEPKGKHNLKYNMNTLISAATNRPVKHGEGKIKPHMYWCEVCEVKLTHPMSAIEHFSSKVHFSKAGVDIKSPKGKRKQDDSVPEPSAKVSRWGPRDSKHSSVSSTNKDSNRRGSDKNVGAIENRDVSIGRDKFSNSVGANSRGFNDKGNLSEGVNMPTNVNNRGPGILNTFIAVLNNQGIIPSLPSDNIAGFNNNPIVGMNNPVNFGNNSGGILNTPVGFGNPGNVVNNPGTSVNNTNFINRGGLNNLGGGVSGGSGSGVGGNIGGGMLNTPVGFGNPVNVVNNPGTSVNNTNFNNRGGLNNRGGGVSGGSSSGVGGNIGGGMLNTPVGIGNTGNVVNNPGTSVNNTNFNNRGGLSNRGGGFSGGRDVGGNNSVGMLNTPVGFGNAGNVVNNPGTSVSNTNFNNRGGLSNRGGGVSGGRDVGVSHGGSVRGGFNKGRGGRGGHSFNNKNMDFDDGKVITRGGFTLSREVKGVQNQGPNNVEPYQTNQQWNNSSMSQSNSFGPGQGNVYQGNNPASYNNASILPTTANVFGNVANQMGGQIMGNFRK